MIGITSVSAPTMTALRNLITVGIQMNRSMQKLSTSLRINRGADDPAGLISSEQ